MAKKVLKDAREVDAMPTIELLECERVAYVNEKLFTKTESIAEQ